MRVCSVGVRRQAGHQMLGRGVNTCRSYGYVDATASATARTPRRRRTHASKRRAASPAARTGSVTGMPACPGPATVVFEPTLTEYDFGPSHPMSPIRVDLTMRLARELGVLDRVRTVPAPMAPDDLVATVHEPAMMEAVMLAGKDPGGFVSSHGLGSDDNPVFHDMHRAASHVVGATVEAFRQVWSGES